MKLFGSLFGSSSSSGGQVLGSAPPPPPPPSLPSPPSSIYDVTFTEADEVLGVALDKDGVDGRPVVVDVTQGGTAQSKGIAVGDKVVSVDGNVVSVYEDFTAILHAVGRPVTFRLERAGVRRRSTSQPVPPSTYAPQRSRVMSGHEEDVRRMERARAAESRTNALDKRLNPSKSDKQLKRQRERELAAIQKARFDETPSQVTPELLEAIKKMEMETAAQLGYNPYESQMASTHVAKAAIEKTPQGALSSARPTPFPAIPPVPIPGAGGGGGMDLSSSSRLVPEDMLQDPNITPEIEVIVQHDLDGPMALFLDQPLEMWRTALTTMHKMVANLLREPHNTKFRRIRLENPAFQSKVGSVPGALEVLMAGGFEVSTEGDEAFLCAPGGPPFISPAIKILFDRLEQTVVQSGNSSG